MKERNTEGVLLLIGGVCLSLFVGAAVANAVWSMFAGRLSHILIP